MVKYDSTYLRRDPFKKFFDYTKIESDTWDLIDVLISVSNDIVGLRNHTIEYSITTVRPW